MALTLTVTWLGASYEAAASTDPSRPEWPPEVVRPFCGMVAVAETDAEWDALRWLERQPPPVVVCPKEVDLSGGRASYVVTQVVSEKDGHATLPLRVNGRDLRQWPRSFPARPECRFVWPAAEPSPAVAIALAGLARRVPYVGRATSPAVVHVSSSDDSALALDGEGFEALHPSDGDAADIAGANLRVLYPGYVDALRDLYADDQPPWVADRRATYTRPAARPPDRVATGPFQDLLAFRFGDGASRDGRHVIALTTALRGAVRSRDADLPAVHGHHDGTVTQVAFLGLPFVGHDHADGRLLGMALALPKELSPDERRAIVRAAAGDPGAGDVKKSRPPVLVAGPVGRLGLELVDEGDRPYAVQPRRWMGPARTWATATPVVLDRFPHRGDDVAAMVAESCVLADFPEPARVEVLSRPAVPGGVVLRPSEAVRRQGELRRLPTRHAVVTFEQPVQGPVVVGNMRHYGLGLCVPFDRFDQEGPRARR